MRGRIEGGWTRPCQEPPSPDEELVHRCRTGDDGAWRALVRRYERLVRAVPFRAGLRREESDEVFHETFARLAENIGSLRDPGSVRSWIATTARNLSHDQVRTAARTRQSRAPEDRLQYVPDRREAPLETLARRESHRLVRRALGRLDARSQRLLSLLFCGPHDRPPSYKTVAGCLGVPVGSIGPTRARCLGRLRAEYQRLESLEKRRLA